MDDRVLARSWIFIALFAFGALCLPVRAASLSDLEAFTRSAANANRILADRGLQQAYRKALESYAPPKGPSAKEFETVWKQLELLRRQGLSSRLLEPRKPMAIQYAAPGKPTFRFERLTRAIHSVWLLENTRGGESCTPKDSLLLDRWAPLLKDVSMFAVEKDGRFIGTTLLLVPIKKAAASYTLVVPSDPSSQLPNPLLEAFLRDYRKREPGADPFAMITQDSPGSALRVAQVDANGKKSQPLGAFDQFQLKDPTAVKIAATAPTRCTPTPSNTAITPASRDIASIPSATTNVFMGAGTAPVSSGVGSGGTTQSAGEKESTGESKNFAAQKPTDLQPGSKKTLPAITANAPSINPVFNNTVNVPAPPNGNGQIPPPQLVTMTPSQQAAPNAGLSTPSSRTPTSIAANPANPSVVNQYFNGANASASPGSNTAGLGRLTQNDQRLLNAMDSGRRALAEHKPVPPGTIRDIARGSLITQNTELQKEAKKAISEMYYKGDPIEAYQALRDVQKQQPELAKNLIKQLNDDLCTYCKDCEYCQALQQKMEGSKIQ